MKFLPGEFSSDTAVLEFLVDRVGKTTTQYGVDGTTNDRGWFG